MLTCHPPHRTRLRPRQAPQGGDPPPARPARPPPRDVPLARAGAPLGREPGRHGGAAGDGRRRPALRLLRQDVGRHAVGARRPAEGPAREGQAGQRRGRPQRQGARPGPAQVPGEGGRGPAVQRRGAGGQCGLETNVVLGLSLLLFLVVYSRGAVWLVGHATRTADLWPGIVIR